MWEIIGALFSGGYLAARVVADKSAAKDAKRKREKWKQNRDTWIAKVTDEALEDELGFFINKHFFDAADKAISLCPNIPEDQKTPTTYLRVLMAEQGKITWHDAVFGLTTPVYEPGKMSTLEVKQKYREFFEFVVCLGRMLKRNGVDEEMLFKPACRGKNANEYYEMSEAGSVPGYGTYEWAPQIITINPDKKPPRKTPPQGKQGESRATLILK